MFLSIIAVAFETTDKVSLGTLAPAAVPLIRRKRIAPFT